MAQDAQVPSRWRVDLTPLSVPDFRLLFASRTVTLLGSQVTEVALLVQAQQLTHSALLVGLLGVTEIVPLVVFALVGGLLADRVDRRRLLLLTEAGLAVVVLALAGNATLTHPHLWPLYAGAGLTMSLAALARPAFDASVPRLAARERLAAASALLSFTSNGAAILGPTIGGVLAAGPGAGWAYGLDEVSYVVSLVLLARLRPLPPAAGAGGAGARVGGTAHSRGALAGLQFIARRQDLIGSYAIDLVAMLLAFPEGLFPFLADRLHAAWSVGLLFAAGSVGAVVVSATSGWTPRVHRYGRAIALAAAVWGAAIVGVGLAPDVGVALACLVVAGGADMVSGLFRTTLWNASVPDEVRGRVAGVEVVSYALGPSAGQLRGGFVADLAGVRAALWSGGLLCVAAVGLICAALPRFVGYDARRSPG